MCKRTNQRIRLIVLAFLSILVTSANIWATNSAGSTEENTFILAKKGLRFARRPELGYVLRTKKETVITLAQQLNQIQVSITGRPQMKVVYGQQPLSEYTKAMEPLSIQPQIEYVAPLFLSDGEVVAVIPEIVVRLKSVLSTTN